MPVREILQLKDSPSLRGESVEVTAEEFGTKELLNLIQDMKDTNRANSGQGIAAAQIGVNKRVSVAFPKGGGAGEVFINPKIIARQGYKKSYSEGCLSLVGVDRKNIRRSKEITVEAQDFEGKKSTFKATGRLAFILQHEIDHFEGKFYTDH